MQRPPPPPSPGPPTPPIVPLPLCRLWIGVPPPGSLPPRSSEASDRMLPTQRGGQCRRSHRRRNSAQGSPWGPVRFSSLRPPSHLFQALLQLIRHLPRLDL